MKRAQDLLIWIVVLTAAYAVIRVALWVGDLAAIFWRDR